jgi:hypothetical protein
MGTIWAQYLSGGFVVTVRALLVTWEAILQGPLDILGGDRWVQMDTV